MAKNSRLKQMPMWFAPALRAVVEALPEREHLLARALHRLVISDDRSWLEVCADAARIERTTLQALLEENRCRAPSAARRHAWWLITEHSTANFSAISSAFGVHRTTVLAGVAKHAARVEQERRAQEDVLAFQAMQQGALRT